MSDLDTVSAHTVEIYRARIRAGCTQLDRTRPGWRARVNRDRLAMALLDRCIVGQDAGLTGMSLREDFNRALTSVTGQEVTSFAEGARVMVPLAFDVDWSLGGHGQDAYGLLTSLWQEELAGAP